jgi:hypothetical protein
MEKQYGKNSVLGKVKITESIYHSLDSESAGICLHCGIVETGIEPDARGYECSECEQKKVYGTQELILMGWIEIVDTLEEVNLAA